MAWTCQLLVRAAAKIPVPSPIVGTIKPGMLKRAFVPMLFMKETALPSTSNRSMATGPKPAVSKFATMAQPQIRPETNPDTVVAPTKQPSKKTSKIAAPFRVTNNIALFRRHSKKPNRQLVVLLAWMMAKDRHLQKYNAFYTSQGFDVLCVCLTPWQLMWPMKGSQMVAGDILSVLETQTQYKSVLIHAFSVGVYLFGEILLQMQQNLTKHEPLQERIVGQIFDSAVDYYGLPTGLPKAIFKNVMAQKVAESYMKYHMRSFYHSATKHYLKSSDMFHNNFIHAPSLFLFSKDDPVGTAEGNLRVIHNWEMNGISVNAKCWDSSPHVSHLYQHPDEYLSELSLFLAKLGFATEPYRRIAEI